MKGSTRLAGQLWPYTEGRWLSGVGKQTTEQGLHNKGFAPHQSLSLLMDVGGRGGWDGLELSYVLELLD